MLTDGFFEALAGVCGPASAVVEDEPGRDAQGPSEALRAELEADQSDGRSAVESRPATATEVRDEVRGAVPAAGAGNEDKFGVGHAASMTDTMRDLLGDGEEYL